MSNNGVFCMLPWVHMHFWPNGNAYPCCVSDSRYALGNTNQTSISEIWNAAPMRELRRNMLADQPSTACARCYELETAGVQTLRQQSLADYSHHHRSVSSTLADGTVPEVNMAYLDVRFSNICNLRCRTCGPELSSGWYDDAVAQQPTYDQPRIININRSGEFWAQLLPYLDQTEEVYFAGGESLLTEEHYHILDHWIATGHTQVRIRYTTNFTVLDYKQRDLFELWRHFPNIHVAASLDASHARGEYLRKNMVWADVVANRERMIREIPQVQFHITPTVSLMNVLHLPDFHREWVELGLLEPDNVRINILDHPEHSSVKALPAVLKDAARSRLHQHTDWLRSLQAKQDSLAAWQSIVNVMDSSDDSHHLKDFYNDTSKLDQLRKESFWDTFPELTLMNTANDTATMCRLPWVNINTTPQGRVKLCCNISDNQHVTIGERPADWSRDDLEQIWNGEYLQQVRSQMLQGKPVRDCQVCYRQEQLNNSSPRLTANVAFAQDSSRLDTVASLPVSFELRTSTRCNLQCKTCWSGSSNLIAEQRKLSLGWANLPENDPQHLALPGWLAESWNEELDHVGTESNGYAQEQHSFESFGKLAAGLKRLYITGGEPTMDANIPRYLDALLTAGNHDCHVSFTTNCTLWNQKLIDKLGQFSNTEIQLSIDAHGAANDFIRQGSHWHEITANVQRYLTMSAASNIKIYTVISAFNCLELEPFIEWVINTVNLHGRKVIWFPIILESPSYQRLTTLPLAARLAAADVLDQRFNEHDWPQHTCDYRDGLAHCLRALRDSDVLPKEEGIYKLREWLFYDWHLRRQRDHVKPSQYWNSVLPTLANVLEWTEEDWKNHG